MTRLTPIIFAVLLIANGALAQQTVIPAPSARPLPEPVLAYVRRQPTPGNPVMISEKVTVGKPIPNNIVLSPVPNTPYAFAVVNQQRVIVDPKTFVVIQFAD